MGGFVIRRTRPYDKLEFLLKEAVLEYLEDPRASDNKLTGQALPAVDYGELRLYYQQNTQT
jgi:hypothetical protein